MLKKRSKRRGKRIRANSSEDLSLKISSKESSSKDFVRKLSIHPFPEGGVLGGEMPMNACGESDVATDAQSES